MKTKILIATHNKGKAREIAAIIESAGASNIEFLLPDDVGIHDSPDETGDDYESNSIIKARYYGEKSGLIAIADDSGLEVESLDGFPGIKSARVAAPVDSDKSRYEVLLEMMESIGEIHRNARFVCAATAFFPLTDEMQTIHEYWNGIILTKPHGGSGFGYDPIFFDPELNKSAAEMNTSEKNRVSHRGKAIRKLWDLISGSNIF